MAAIELVSSLNTSSQKYRELATGILLQYADSEMAGGSGYSQLLALCPGLNERVQLATMAAEKLSLAQRAYELVAQTGINTEKYLESHCWESRLHRHVRLGYRRASADKRLNALLYPIQGWDDLLVFTYLMASMACLQLKDFSKSSFQPWSELAKKHINVENAHKNFGLSGIEKLSCIAERKQLLLQSISYWGPRVQECFGPAHSERNKDFIELGIKTQKNEELSAEWIADVKTALNRLDIETNWE